MKIYEFIYIIIVVNVLHISATFCGHLRVTIVAVEKQ